MLLFLYYFFLFYHSKVITCIALSQYVYCEVDYLTLYSFVCVFTLELFFVFFAKNLIAQLGLLGVSSGYVQGSNPPPPHCNYHILLCTSKNEILENLERFCFQRNSGLFDCNSSTVDNFEMFFICVLLCLFVMNIQQ